MTKKIIFLTFVLIIMICSFTYFYKKNNIAYNSKVVSLMKKYNIYNEINKNNYSKTLEIALESGEFQEQYATIYQEIDYIERKNFIKDVNTLLSNNYSSTEINTIFQKYNNIKNFEINKVNNYEEYQKKNNCSLEEAVLKVNIGLDHDFYTQINEINNSHEYTVLVNKYHSLGNYEPTDLKSLSYDSKYQLREKAADAFEELVASAKLDNLFIRPYSAYRSYDRQELIYNNYVARDGKDEADTYSARPGHSEHQTGLAVDVWSEGYNYIKDNDAKWLKNNSYKYGFIVRYTKENQPITGYIEEPWHLRYLGKEIATDVVAKNLTYDEYYDLYIK